MKALLKLVVPTLALAVLMTASAGCARSQMTSPPKNDQAARTTEPNGPASPVTSPHPTTAWQIKADSLSVILSRQATIQSMTRVVAQIVRAHGSGLAEKLRAGQVIDITTMIDTENNVASWHSVNVKASYDARPIGGILNIRVGLAPVFGGIGSAIRSVNFREFAEAINEFDDNFIVQTISRLTKELGEEYASR